MMKKAIGAAIFAALTALPIAGHAQVRTYDSQSFAQHAAQWVDHIANLKNQLTQQMNMLKSMTGSNGYGALLGNTSGSIKQLLPSDWGNVYDDATSSGSSFAGAASNLTSSFNGKVDGMSRLQGLQYTMQQMQSKGAYDRSMTQNVYNDQMQELNELDSLQNEIDTTTSVKDTADLQARIQTLQGQIQAQDTKLKMMAMLQQSQDKLISAQREEAARRYSTGDVGELPDLDVTQ